LTGGEEADRALFDQLLARSLLHLTLTMRGNCISVQEGGCGEQQARKTRPARASQ
jgi:hypothetical protein